MIAYIIGHWQLIQLSALLSSSEAWSEAESSKPVIILLVFWAPGPHSEVQSKSHFINITKTLLLLL